LRLPRFNANGTFDNSFSDDGKLITDFANGSENANTLAIHSDGKIVAAGNSNAGNLNLAICRYNPDGALDKTFSDDGKQTGSFGSPYGDYIKSIAIQSDGKIVAAGSVIVRYNTDGSLDSTYDGRKDLFIDKSSFRAESIASQNDDKIVVAFISNEFFSFVRLNANGSLDSAFGTNGIIKAPMTEVNALSILDNKLFAVGSLSSLGGVSSGIVARYLLGESFNLSCPSSKITPADKGRCDAVVNNIAPVLQGGNTQINYALSGATIATGKGSISGKRFNKGVTTVTYSLANDASKNCSFTVTVNDKEPSSITNVAADFASLWPPNHKMKKVTISYDVKDNCGFNSPALSVSSNETRENNDWIVIDNHHVQLRAEKGKRGSERIYTITIGVTDLSGNQSIKTINVGVSKNKTTLKSNAANRSIIIDEGNIQNLIVNATPNPSQNYFTVLSKSNSDKPINLRATDVLGRLVETRLNIAANGKLQIGSNYGQGIYFVEVVQGTQRQLIKLVKQ